MKIKTKAGGARPLLWIPTLYFAMGLPFVTINATSGIMFKNMGVSDAKIAFWTAFIILPWTLKPLWSPFLEIYMTKRFFAITTQLACGILFALLTVTLPLADFFSKSIAILSLIAFCGATHDIAADGIYIHSLSNGQQAKYVGWQGAFYNLAKIFSIGFLVYIAGILEKQYGVTKCWIFIMFMYSIVMIILSIYHHLILPKDQPELQRAVSSEQIFCELWEVISSFFTKRNIVWSITFIILYRFAEGFAMKIAPLFFKADREDGGLGLSTSQIGLIYGTYGSAAFIFGSVLAGYFISKKGLKKSLVWLCAIFNIPFAVYAVLAIFQPTDIATISSAVIFEYFGYGFGFVALILYMMQQVAPGKNATAHYAFATGIMNLGVMIPGMLSGLLSDWLGYRMFFIWVLVATIPAFLVSIFVPFSYPDSQK